MLAIYRKYRPRKLSEVLGQETVAEILKNAGRFDKLAHAYLFYGPRGSGKTTTARIIAKIANCEKRQKDSDFKKEGEPCNQCPACIEIDKGAAMDVIEIDAASNRGIDEIRNLKESIRVSPTSYKYKVFIIDECLTGDHLISMADGSVKKISEIGNGEKINSIDIATGKIISRPVTKWFKRKTDKIVEVKTPQTLLKTTPTHRLWILRDGEFLLTEAKNLKINDFLLSPIYLPHFQKNNLTPEQLSLIALIQCDGHISNDSITVQVEIKKDKDYFQEIFKKGVKSWGIKEKPVIKTTSRGTKLIRIYSKKLKDLLIEMDCPAGRKSNLIDIPNIIFQAPLESIKAYIDTCFCCEGDIIPFGYAGNINYRLNFSSASEIFVKKLQLLFKKFGIGSNIFKIKRHNKNHSDIYRVSLSGYNLRLFSLNIGLSLKRKAELLEKYLQKREKQDSIPIEQIILTKRKEKKLAYSELVPLGIYPAKDQHLSRKSVEAFIKIGNFSELAPFLNYRYEKIKNIKVVNKSEWVYDFTVEGTHTFIANGICSSNCHQLTKEAFNALLKTLEEPPAHAIFILATTEYEKMPATIASRTQRFHFKKLPLLTIVEKLKNIVKAENIKISGDAIELIAAAAEGSLRDAESLLDQLASLEENIEFEDVEKILGKVGFSRTAEMAELLLKNDLTSALDYLAKINEGGYNILQFNKDLIHYLRRALALKFSPALEETFSRELTDRDLKKIKEHSRLIDEKKTIELMKSLLRAYAEMRYSPFAIVPLEVAIIEKLKE